MNPNPYERNMDSSFENLHHHRKRRRVISARSANEPLVVLLAGFNSFFAQHLWYPLKNMGLEIIPVTREPSSPFNAIQTLSQEQIREQGLPDVDVIINCSGTNLYHPLDKWNKQEIELSRFQSNKFWAEEIRKVRSKPYVYAHLSSCLYYPSSDTRIYDETYSLPPVPLPWETDLPEIRSQELSMPYWSRLFRNAEHNARVFRPEEDARTPEQIAEYNQMKERYLNDDVKFEVYTGMGAATPAQQRDSSNRKDLLTNSEVRVINFRHGHLLAKTMQEHVGMQPWLDRGLLSRIGTGQSKHPWIHVDDAVNLLIHSIFDHNISGPVNAVAPNLATNHQLIDYMATARRSGTMNRYYNISEKTVDSVMSPLLGQVYHQSRHVIPKKALESGFEWMYPDVPTLMEKGLISNVDKEVIIYGGWENAPRNRGRNHETGYDEERHPYYH
jgi:NAD dependent epimerase/dehydratase family enzyme